MPASGLRAARQSCFDQEPRELSSPTPVLVSTPSPLNTTSFHFSVNRLNEKSNEGERNAYTPSTFAPEPLDELYDVGLHTK